MINVFSQFSVPQLSKLARRTALAGLLIGVVGLVGLVFGGYPLAGVGLCFGLAMALGNFRLISAATVKASRSGRENTRRPLVANTLGRMAVISVIALGLVFVDRQLGFGTLVGLAVFQFLLIANVVVTMLRDPSFTAAAVGGGSSSGGDEA